MNLAACMHLNIVSRCRNSLNVFDSEEVRAIANSHENLLWRCAAARSARKQPPRALLKVAAVGLRERFTHARDALQKAVSIERLEQVVERIDLKGAHSMLRVRGGEYNQRGGKTAQLFECLEPAARAELNVKVEHVRAPGCDGCDCRLD